MTPQRTRPRARSVRLLRLAKRAHSVSSLDGLVLHQSTKAQLRELERTVKQGRASRLLKGPIGLLFVGPDWTGKTAAAEVLGTNLGLDLYRIDLSKFVSKYIGETEKNLNRLFTAAESGDVLLFFDEAEALFGKRSEVKDSHDRYANMEVSYLLQRLEAYKGLFILATNRRQDIDEAFVRRFHSVVEFPILRISSQL